MKRFWLSGLGIGILLGLLSSVMAMMTGFRPSLAVGGVNLLFLLAAIGTASFVAGKRTGSVWAGAGQAALAVAMFSLIGQTFLWVFGPSPVQLAMEEVQNLPVVVPKSQIAHVIARAQILVTHPVDRYLQVLMFVLIAAVIGGILGLLGGYMGKRLGAAEREDGGSGRARVRRKGAGG